MYGAITIAVIAVLYSISVTKSYRALTSKIDDRERKLEEFRFQKHACEKCGKQRVYPYLGRSYSGHYEEPVGICRECGHVQEID